MPENPVYLKIVNDEVALQNFIFRFKYNREDISNNNGSTQGDMSIHIPVSDHTGKKMISMGEMSKRTVTITR